MAMFKLQERSLLIRISVFAVVAVMAGAPSQAQEVSSPPASEAVQIFDGKTLDGWVVLSGSATYQVEDGVIVGTTAEGSPNSFLCTTRDFANFELEFDVKCDADLNSGVQIRSHIYTVDTPQPSNTSRIRLAGEVYGYQCEIAPKNETSGNFWDEGRHTRWHDDLAEKPGAPSAYKPGEWNHYRIVANGNQVQSWVNGIACADFTDGMDSSGFIGLQVHGIKAGSGPFQVRWKNLKLREFSINPGINDSFESPDVEQYTERFERESREVYDLREEIVAELDLKPGMAVADIGTGTGLFTRLFAKGVGPQGKVYAVDVAKNFVEHAEKSSRDIGLNNVQGVVCTASDSRLPENSVDLIYICDTYHHFEFPYQTMQSLHRALRPNGRLILVDFVKEAGVSSEFIMGHVRAPESHFTHEIEQCGFQKVGKSNLLTENYLLTFRKTGGGASNVASAEPTVRRFADIPYREGNDAWKLDVFMPPGSFDRPRPAIVFVHGGGWRGGDKGAGQWQAYPERFAHQGYVTVSVNYRLTDQAPFPACVEDVKCAVRWLRAHARHYGIDAGRIGAYGNSAGAHLVSMLGLVGPAAGLEGDGPYAEQSSLVQAVCASATPTDFLNWHSPIQGHRALEPLLAGPEDSLNARAAKASPITYVHKDAPPFLLVQGGKDTTVDISQSDSFVKALREAGAAVEYLTYDDAGHGVFGQNAKETLPAMEKFFGETIGDNAD